jgi:ABC-2 type transport system permease protein
VVVGMLHRPGLGRWLPSGAASALTAPGGGTLPGWAGGLVFAAYGLGLALVGGRLVVRRDLT